MVLWCMMMQVKSVIESKRKILKWIMRLIWNSYSAYVYACHHDASISLYFHVTAIALARFTMFILCLYVLLLLLSFLDLDHLFRWDFSRSNGEWLPFLFFFFFEKAKQHILHWIKSSKEKKRDTRELYKQCQLLMKKAKEEKNIKKRKGKKQACIM